MPLSLLCNEGTLEVQQSDWRVISAWPNCNLECLGVREVGHWKWKSVRRKNVFFHKHIPCGEDSTVVPNSPGRGHGQIWNEALIRAEAGRGIVAVYPPDRLRSCKSHQLQIPSAVASCRALSGAAQGVRTGPTPCSLCARPEKQAKWYAGRDTGADVWMYWLLVTHNHEDQEWDYCLSTHGRRFLPNID